MSKIVVVRQIVEVWGKQYELVVHQKSASVWVASGEFNGNHVQAEGRTSGAAAKMWAERTRYASN